MSTAENGLLKFEGGRTSYTMEALSDSGDAITFDSNAILFSGYSGSEPDIKPDGLATGGVVIAAVSGSNDVVDIAALSCYLAGVKTAVSAGIDTAITRATGDLGSVSSITINSSGAFVVVQGTDSTDQTVNGVRDSAGGPPLIPVGSIEIAQVRTTTNVAGAITAAEIFQVIGLHQERYDSPQFRIDSFNAQVVMSSALPLIHTGSLPKGVSASYADPLFIDLPKTNDYKPSGLSHSPESKQYHGETGASTSSSLGGGSFTVDLNDGVSDSLVKNKDNILWFKFFPDRYKSAYILDQGKLGMDITFPSSSNINSSCTISPASAAVGVES
ncbi:MAG: hypothetical protein KZQ83_14945 [gamma proteobacterium symbiont of Taylorina sp.]|nr:hypothetical protein [gamma proteobacterium symbiont of Taylorina sp.]